VQKTEPTISIVVPVFNEVPSFNQDSLLIPRIRQLIELLRPIDELILVDGGSTDFSWAALLALEQFPQVKAIQGSKGRAVQMNLGASNAKGDVLLFLHADTVLPISAWNKFLKQVSHSNYASVWGRFDVRIVGQSKWLPVVAWFMNHRSRLSKICTGDQGLFVSRNLFLQVRGFLDQPLMEDIAICQCLRRLAAKYFVAIRTPVETSGRRWDNQGVWKTIVLMWRLRFQYWCGVSASKLAQHYADTREKFPVTVAVFAKFPEPGRVKTRLEPLLGAKQCADFARYLLLSTLDKLKGIRVVLWTDGGTDAQWLQLLNGRVVQRRVQAPGHLGLRMQVAVQEHLITSDVVVLLGPDAVQFTMNDLFALIQSVKKESIAFIPALDGGYVALACKHCWPAVFSHTIDWGSACVAEQTQAALLQSKIAAVWLAAQRDLDEPEDYLFALQQGDIPADWSQCY
jgi:rSAM/selenodomain-associated transferase 2/rSAM/selenodomain-associated transferase 1